MEKISGQSNTFLSLDTPDSDNVHSYRLDNVHTHESCNTISASGLLNHVLNLKNIVRIMLLRNICMASGLCNGTRLIITKMRKICALGKGII